MANVRMNVGYNFLYETSGLLHIYGMKAKKNNKERKDMEKKNSVDILRFFVFI